MSRIKTLCKRILQKKDLLTTTNFSQIAGYFYYNKHAKDLPIKDQIFFECRQGSDLQGNIFFLLTEALKKTNQPCILAVKRSEKARVLRLLDHYNMTTSQLKVVNYKSKKYYKALASSKYLITDVTFPTNFIKREGQIYLNTWHGTPMKSMGRKSAEAKMVMGNIQRNFMQADYLILPNNYTKELMIESYNIKELCPNLKCIVHQYPRARVYTRVRQQEIESKKTTGKRVYAYLPTWRERPVEKIARVLQRLNNACPKYAKVMVRLHPLDSQKVDLSKYSRLEPMPEDIEMNDFLAKCDGLITDYSSVLFDYAYTHKPIVLYQYDKEAYESTRGIEIRPDLPTTSDAKEVFELLKKPVDYKNAMKPYCPLNEGDSVLTMLLNTEERKEKKTEDEYIVFYLGNLAKNGITIAGIALINELAKDKNKKVILTSHMQKSKKNKSALSNLSENIIYYPLAESFLGYGTLLDFIKSMIYLFTARGFKGIRKSFERTAKTYEQAQFRNLKIKHLVHYTGYEFDKIMTFSNTEARTKSIFVHNDMTNEVFTKGTLQKDTLEYGYAHFDNVVLVSEAISKPTEVFTKDKEKMRVLPNIINTEEIRAKGDQGIEFNEDTECKLTRDEYVDFLNKHEYNFVSIGRYSREKRHDRTLSAFRAMQGMKNAPKSSLTIIGGYGEDYNFIKALEADDEDIVSIKSIENPQPILRKCDCLLLFSDFEAQPLVLYEGAIQGCQLITTDIPTSRAVIEQIGGYVADKNIEKLAEVMKQVANKKEGIGIEQIDLAGYNTKTVEKINAFFEQKP